MPSLFELIFGQPTIKALREDLSECEYKRRVLIKNYQQALNEKLQLILDYGKDKIELHQQIRDLERLLEEVEAGIIWPEFWQNHDPLELDVSTIQAFREVEFVRADAMYLAFTLTDWKEIIALVYPLVKSALERWERDISDCDNWSTVMAAFISILFKKNGFDMQGAFAITHTIDEEPSRHAYNIFVTKDRKVYTMEPQNGKVLLEMKDYTSGLYKTGYVWFLS